MEKVEPRPAASSGTPANTCCESLSDLALTITAVVGGVCGAIGGAFLGAEVGTAFPVVCGTLGTMLGSGLAAGGFLLTETRAERFVARRRDDARPVAAMRTAG